MADIGTLAVKLVANTQGFVAGIQGAASSFTSFGRTAFSFAGSLSSVIGTAVGSITKGFAIISGAVTLAGGTFVYWQKQMFDAIGGIVDNADKLGIASTSLAALQYSADLAGASTEALQAGLQKMVKNISEAANGNKAAAQSFKSLGLDINALKGMSAEKQFLAIAGALEQVGNAGNRLRLTMNVFGKGGADLLPLLRQGKQAIAEQVREAERFGLAWDDVGFRIVESAGDALSRVWKLLEGIGDQIAVQVAPYVEALANKLVDVATAGGSIGEQVTNGAEMAVNAIVKLSSYVASFKLGLSGLKYSILEVGESFTKMRLRALNFADNLGIMDVSKDILAATSELENIQKEMGKTLFDMGKTIFTFPSQDEVAKFFNDIRDKARANTAQAVADAAKATGDLGDAVDKATNQRAGQGALALNIARDNFTSQRAAKSPYAIGPDTAMAVQYNSKKIALAGRTNELLERILQKNTAAAYS